MPPELAFDSGRNRAMLWHRSGPLQSGSPSAGGLPADSPRADFLRTARDPGCLSPTVSPGTPHRMGWRPLGRLGCILGVILGLSAATPRAAESEVSFVRDVAPILTRHCTGCHGPNKGEGDYRLHTFAGLSEAGASDSPPLTPGDPERSELWLRLVETSETTRMPQLGDPLPAAEMDLVARWIRQGAKFDGRDPRTSFKTQMPPRVHPAPPEIYRVPIPVQAVAFSPTGDELVLGGHHEVTVWDPQTATLLRRIAGLPKRIQALVFEPGGERLVVAGGTPGDYGEVVALDARDGGHRQVLQVAEDLVLSLSLSHDGRQLVCGGADRVVRGFTREEGGPWEHRWDSRIYSDWITGVAHGAGDAFILVGCRDATAKVLTPDGALFTTYNGHQRQFGGERGRFEIHALATEAEGPRIFTAGQGRMIRVWEATKAQVENGSAADMEERFAQAGHTLYWPHDAVRGVTRLTTAGPALFVATGDGRLRQHRLPEGTLVREYPSQGDWLFGLALHPGTNRVVTTTRQGIARLWDTTTGQLLREWQTAPGLELRPEDRLAQSP